MIDEMRQEFSFQERQCITYSLFLRGPGRVRIEGEMMARRQYSG